MSLGRASWRAATVLPLSLPHQQVFPALRNPFCPSRLPGQYYGLLLLSVRAAAYHLMHANATGFKSERDQGTRQ